MSSPSQANVFVSLEERGPSLLGAVALEIDLTAAPSVGEQIEDG
jgi:hypothetical protein